MEFNLTYRRRDFENIYYADDKGSYLRSEHVKRSVKFLIASVIGFIISLVYGVYGKNYTSTLYAGLLLAIILFIYISGVIELNKWKNTVRVYLDTLDEIVQHSLSFGQSFISITQDGSTHKYALTEFTTIDITDKYIWLHGENHILIPSASLGERQFEVLKEMVENYFN